MPRVPPLIPPARSAATLARNEGIRLARQFGLPVLVADDGPFDAVRTIPLPMNDGGRLRQAAAADPRPAATWTDLTQEFDLPNIGRTSRAIGQADGAFDRPIPLFTTQDVRVRRVQGNDRSIQNLEVVAGGVDGRIHRDSENRYREALVPIPRRVASTQYLAFPVADLLRMLAVRVPSVRRFSSYPVAQIPDHLTAAGRVLTPLLPGFRGLPEGHQLDVSLVLSIATLGGTRFPPVLQLPTRDGPLRVDGAYCAVSRIDAASPRPFPLRTDFLAPAWGVAAGDFERVIGPTAGHESSYQAGDRKFAPIAATVRTLPRNDATGQSEVTGLGRENDPVSFLDGLDLNGFEFGADAPADPNREIAQRHLLLQGGRAENHFPERRVRITLSFATLPRRGQNGSDAWTAEDDGPEPGIGKTQLIVQASLIWLDTQRNFAAGQAAPDERTVWQAKLMQTPRYLDLENLPVPEGLAHNRGGSPSAAMAPGLYGGEFDYGIVVGAFSGFADSGRGLRVRVDEVQARFSQFDFVNADPRLFPGVSSDLSGMRARVPRPAWVGEINPAD